MKETYVLEYMSENSMTPIEYVIDVTGLSEEEIKVNYNILEI